MQHLLEGVVHTHELFYVRDVLLMTRHQLKVGVVLGLLGLIALTVVWLLHRAFARHGSKHDSAASPFELPESPADPQRSRPVDAAVANVLAKAAAQPGDTRSTGDLLPGAIRIVADLGGVSVPALQRKLEIDFATATELVERLESDGYVSEPAAGGKRKVLPKAFEYVEEHRAPAGDA